VNLLAGVVTGLALAMAAVLWRVVRAGIHAEPLGARDEQRWRVVIDGSCSFLALPRLSHVLASVPSGSHVTVELEVDFLDHPVQDTLDAWRRRHVSNGGTVEIEESGTASLREAQDRPPVRGSSRSALRGGFAPWRSWQRHGRTGHTGPSPEVPGPLSPVLAGVDNYHRRHAHLLRPHVQELSAGQDPDTLFLTCADSRLVPNLITSSGPGDLFTVRNVGNVVGNAAGGDSLDPSVEAALEFALKELSVKSVVICGHSGCGAMSALMAEAATAPERSTAMPGTGRDPVDVWLDHARPSMAAFRAGHTVQAEAANAGYGETDQLAMVNVAIQLEQLQRHHSLRQALRSGELHLTGLFYDIATAQVLQVTPAGISHLDPLPRATDGAGRPGAGIGVS
jgi:carbonic anhydrase